MILVIVLLIWSNLHRITPEGEMQAALGVRIRATMEARLGRCSRCMTLSAALVLLSWLSVAALARIESPLGVFLAAALVATGFSLLAVAHLAAFVARRAAPIPMPARQPSAAPTIPEPARTVVAPRGCGCGPSSAPQVPVQS